MNSDSRSTLADRIAQTENGLLPPVVIRGRPAAPMTLAERMDFYQVPAVSIAVLAGGQVAWSGTYGTLKPGAVAEVPTDTQFQAGSISKTVATAAALALVDRGHLDLAAPINQQIRSWKLPENDLTRASPVTLRGLLSHMAGEAALPDKPTQ